MKINYLIKKRLQMVEAIQNNPVLLIVLSVMTFGLFILSFDNNGKN